MKTNVNGNVALGFRTILRLGSPDCASSQVRWYSIRICGDYKVTVNAVAKLETYPLPKVEDLFAALSGGILFSKLDLSHAYQQLVLEEDSRKYTTINTTKGLFQYLRLPFGISSAPSIFQRTMETLLREISDVVVYIDDILHGLWS